MCGLVGFINRDVLPVPLKAFIHQSLIVNSLRGTDGAGLLLVDQAGEQHIYKRALPGWDLAQLIPARRMIEEVTNPVFGIIHSRAATGVGKTTEYSHPVMHEHITLAHNGVVSNVMELSGSGMTHDSTAIAMALAEKGNEALELLRGAYALIWYNVLEQSLNVARNDDRPLYIATVKKSGNMFFASEEGLLLWIADRNNIAIKDISPVKSGIHLTFHKDAKEKATLREFTPRKVDNYNYNSTRYPINAYQVPTYVPVVRGEEFVGIYQGAMSIGGKGYAKFRHIRDKVYAWTVPIEPGTHLSLVEEELYKLRAVQERLYPGNAMSLDAELMSNVPLVSIQSPIEGEIVKLITEVKSHYPIGNYVKFLPTTIMYRGSRRLNNVVGITDDTNDVEVRAYNISPDIKLEADAAYKGAIKSILVNKAGQEYLVLDPKTISPDKEAHDCGWCSKTLTLKEYTDNEDPHSGYVSLCDDCFSSYAAINKYN